MTLSKSASKVPVTDSFRYKNWIFECRKGPIWGANELDAAAGELLPGASPVDRVPDAFFGHNFLRIHFVPGCDASSSARVDHCATKESVDDAISVPDCPGCIWALEMSPIAAANGMSLEPSNGRRHCFPETFGFTPTYFKVKHAESWQKRLAAEKAQLYASGEIETIDSHYDWTCASRYWGSVYNKCSAAPEGCFFKKLSSYSIRETEPTWHSDSSSIIRRSGTDPPDIPLDLLRDTSLPILWLQHCDIFSDDLSDSGSNTTDVKIRVMPTFWFLLYTQLIRVDNVALRRVEVRYFHQFGTSTVLRECLWTELSCETYFARVARQDVPGAPSKRVMTFDALNSPQDVVFRIVQHLQLPS